LAIDDVGDLLLVSPAKANGGGGVASGMVWVIRSFIYFRKLK